ncbi:MAG: hypothetical protein M0R33_09645 [Methylomonas sp.]|uniref:hypothetical protein n=1 Tax=Methylomonas sp. TaxID=418 RepID=UPI0025F6AA73|nr:hypothetical protein [Methylomonas sp.]MCK9606694.1 hypothetical protein [Methylomonas sp.]
MSEQSSTNSQQNFELTGFPAVSTAPSVKPRQFRTALPYPYYARLEVQAAKRGMSGYAFASELLKRVLDANFPEKSGC